MILSKLGHFKIFKLNASSRRVFKGFLKIIQSGDQNRRYKYLKLLAYILSFVTYSGKGTIFSFFNQLTLNQGIGFRQHGVASVQRVYLSYVEKVGFEKVAENEERLRPHVLYFGPHHPLLTMRFGAFQINL